jgi:hypothetical protein
MRLTAITALSVLIAWELYRMWALCMVRARQEASRREMRRVVCSFILPRIDLRLTGDKQAPDEVLTDYQRDCKAIANKCGVKVERIAEWDESQKPSRDELTPPEALRNPADPPRPPGGGVQ